MQGTETHNNSDLNKMFISPSNKSPQVCSYVNIHRHAVKSCLVAVPCEFLRDLDLFHFNPKD